MRKALSLRGKARSNGRKKMIDKPETPASRAGASVAAKPATASAAGAGPQSAAAGAGERQPAPATIRYLDRPDVEETFADSITGLIFDGQTLRIEFGVTRLDEVRANMPVTGRRYPAVRVVLPPTAAVELINRMQQIANALTQSGVARAAPRPGDGPKAS
jgi:hypothetical protein